jgi:hypothetical protein
MIMIHLQRPGNRSGRAALRREQQEQLESNHYENRATEKEGRPITCHRRRPSENKKCDKPMGTSSLEEGDNWRVDQLLGNGHKISDENSRC